MPISNKHHPGHASRLPRRLALLGVSVAVGATLAGAAAAPGPSGGGDPVPAPPLLAELAPYVVAPAVSLEPVAPTSGPPKPPSSDPAAGPPVRLVVPRLGVNAPVIGADVRDGTLWPPDDPRRLGWWTEGAAPGAVAGGALITGHTVHSGGGAFDDLETLRRGDVVKVRTKKGVLEYAVSAVTVYRKSTLARDAERVFSQTVPGRLVLITCEDWNGSGYDSNAVVLADPI